jgi:hypothetical protein
MDWQAAYKDRARAAVAKTWWDEAPQDTELSYVVLTDVTEIRPQTLTDWDLRYARVQIDSWAETKAEAAANLDALLAVLVPGGTSGGWTFQRAEVELIRGGVDRTAGTPVRFRSADLTFNFT